MNKLHTATAHEIETLHNDSDAPLFFMYDIYHETDEINKILTVSHDIHKMHTIEIIKNGITKKYYCLLNVLSSSLYHDKLGYYNNRYDDYVSTSYSGSTVQYIINDFGESAIKPSPLYSSNCEALYRQNVFGQASALNIINILNAISNADSIMIDGEEYDKDISIVGKVWELDHNLAFTLFGFYSIMQNAENTDEYYIRFLKILGSADLSNDEDLQVKAKSFAIHAVDVIRSQHYIYPLNILMALMDFIIDVRVDSDCVVTRNGKCYSFEYPESENNLIDLSKYPNEFNIYSLLPVFYAINTKLIAAGEEPLQITFTNANKALASYDATEGRSNYTRNCFNMQELMYSIKAHYIEHKCVAYPVEYPIDLLDFETRVKIFKTNLHLITECNMIDYCDAVKALPQINDLIHLFEPEEYSEINLPKLILEEFNDYIHPAVFLLSLYDQQFDVAGRETFCMQLLDLIDLDDLGNEDNYHCLMLSVSLAGETMFKWLNKNKKTIVKYMRNAYQLSNNISDDILFNYILIDNGFIDERAVVQKNKIIEIINSSKKVTDDMERLFESTNKLENMKSTLLKDLFINVYMGYSIPHIIYKNKTKEASTPIKTATLYKLYGEVFDNLLSMLYKSTKNYKNKILNAIYKLLELDIFGEFNTKDKLYPELIKFFNIMLSSVNKAYIDDSEKTAIVTRKLQPNYYHSAYAYYIDEVNDIIKLISEYPELPVDISVYFTEKYLAEH